MRRWLPSTLIAVTTSALAVAVNFATGFPHSWWLWVLVGLLTVVSAMLVPKRQDPPPSSRGTGAPVQNQIDGLVSGNVVQASKVEGGVVFGQEPGRRRAR